MPVSSNLPLMGLADLRIALIGCGAVSELYYVPALTAMPEHSIEWFVDTTVERARQLAKNYGKGNVSTTYRETIGKVDAAIVAVPNFLHARISIDYLNAGRDVLCEKPLAMSVQEGQKMINAGEKSGARLAINLIRRRFDNYRMAKDIVGRGAVGNVTKVTLEEGSILAWPFASSFMLDKKKSGGGTLIDVGPHVIDILQWLFAGHSSVLSYTDDALGGIEADCEVRLEIKSAGGSIPCTITLSRVRKLGNNLVIHGEAGSLEVRPFDFSKVRLSVGDCVGQLKREESLEYKSQVDYFVDQVRAFADKSCTDIADGEEGLKTLAVIEECYRKRQSVSYPWEKLLQSDAGRLIPSQYQKILIVGASGLVGTRLSERLVLDLKTNVRAAIHRPEAAARLARLPLEFVECNLLERNQVMDAVEGCDVIVNLARDRSGDNKNTFDVLVRGTKNLLESAAEYRVKKFIHVSSAAVHGFRHEAGSIDESTPLRNSSDPYVRGKVKSEELVMDYSNAFPVVIIRPTLIYGPFSVDWVANIIERIKDQRAMLIGENKQANLTHVDNVVEAILLAIEKKEANGQAFVVNDDEETVMWADYTKLYSDLVGVPAVAVPDMSYISLASKETGSLLKASAVAAKRILRSPELLELIAQIPLAFVLGGKVIKGERKDKMQLKLRSGLEIPKPEPETLLLMNRKYLMTSRSIYDVLSTRAVFSASKAKRLLGFRPYISLTDGLSRTSEWIKWARLA
jgi:predicted dehydrogenase/nucleoside-diphosphate-sugar epimerase